MPNLPTMSIEAAEQMAKYGNRTMETPLMIVSKDRNVQGDFYTESDAEEMYVPDSHLRNYHRNKRQSLVTDDS